MKERRCDNCAWGRAQDADDVTQAYCHYEREPIRVYAGWWCRHWSETTGWDVFEKEPNEMVEVCYPEKVNIMKGLLRLASELFEKELDVVRAEGSTPLKEALNPSIRERWLEEYRTKC